MTSTNPSVVVIPTQGFCNRLRALASAHILANYWKTKCYVIWEKEEGCNVQFDDIFSCQFETIGIQTVAKAKHYFSPQVHTNNVLTNDLQSYEYLVIQGGHEFKHPDMSVFAFLQHKHAFYNSLTFSASVNGLVESKLSAFQNKKVIGIHFRDFIEKYDRADGYDFTKASPLENFVHWIKKICDEQPQTWIFLSSNTNRIIDRLGNDSAIQQRIITLSHSDKRRDSVEGIVHAVADLLLLSKCNYIIGSVSSSFSDEACFFHFISKYCLGKRQSVSDSYHCYGFDQIYGENMLLPNINILCDMYKENNLHV